LLSRRRQRVSSPEEFFGPNHAAETAQRLGIPFLGQLLINTQIACLCDEGAIEDYPGEEFTPIVEHLLQAATR